MPKAKSDEELAQQFADFFPRENPENKKNVSGYYTTSNT